LLGLVILTSLLLGDLYPTFAGRPDHRPIDLFSAGAATHPGEVRLLTDNSYYDTLILHIKQAREKINMAMFLFKTTGSAQNRPALIMKELIQAKTRGVAVHVLLEVSNHDQNLNHENRKTAEFLRSGGVSVTFDQPETTTHTKLVIIDNRYVFLGSHNLTQAALAYNHESSLLLDSPELAAELARYMQTLGY